MNRFKPYSRRELNRHRRIWLRRNATVVALLCIGTLALVGAVSWFVSSLGGSAPFRWYVIGALQASCIGVLLHLLNAGFLASDAAAIRHVRGAWGEENTRSELQRAKRRRLIWGWVDAINLQSGDIDHLVVTRRGGLVVLDSKWRNDVVATARDEMVRDAQRARSRSEGILRTLMAADRTSRHRARTKALPVRAAIVLWGAAQHSLPTGVVVDDVSVVSGRSLVSWLRELSGDDVDRTAARDALEKLTEFRATSWQQNTRA